MASLFVGVPEQPHTYARKLGTALFWQKPSHWAQASRALQCLQNPKVFHHALHSLTSFSNTCVITGVVYTYVQQTAAGTSSVVKTGVAAGDMKAAVEAMAAGGGLSPVETAKENGDGAAVAKGAPEEEEEAEGGGPDDDEDDSPPRELDLVGCCWWWRRRRLEWSCCWLRV